MLCQKHNQHNGYGCSWVRVMLWLWFVLFMSNFAWQDYHTVTPEVQFLSRDA